MEQQVCTILMACYMNCKLFPRNLKTICIIPNLCKFVLLWHLYYSNENLTHFAIFSSLMGEEQHIPVALICI